MEVERKVSVKEEVGVFDSFQILGSQTESLCCF